MNDLRRDIKEVFAKQQGQLGDAAGTSNRMLRAATAGRRVNPQLWPSVAGVALVLVAASAIGVSVVIRGLHSKNVVTNHPSPTLVATPSATPAPTPMSQLLQVPATTPVILFHDSVDVQQIDGVTWDGSARGRVGATDAGMGFVQNPAGTLYGWTDSIHDRSGAVVATLPVITKGFPGTWADDGRHLCSMVGESPFGQPGGKPTTLQVSVLGQSPRNVVQVGRAYEQTSIGVAACSIERDRAVIVQSGGQGSSTAQFWVVQLSTGRIEWTRSYTQDGLNTVDIRPSRDGEFIAEIKYTCCPATANTTTIYGPTGTVLGHSTSRIQAFSWDGSLAVVAEYGGPVSVIRWRDRTVVWRGPAGGGYLDAMPEPGGQRIAVSLSDPAHPQTGGFPPRNVWAVGPDGQAIELLTNVQ